MTNGCKLKMRSICFVMDFLYLEKVGGAEVQAWILAKEFAKKGWKVDYVTQSLNGKYGLSEVRDNVQIHWLKPRPLFGFVHWFRMQKYLKRIGPDICYQRIPSFLTGIVAHWCRKNGKPFIFACPEDSMCVKNYFTTYLRELISSKQYDGNFYKRLVLTLSTLIKDRIYLYGFYCADLILAQNSYQQKQFKNNLCLESTVLLSGHEVPDFMHNDGLSLETKKPVILYVGILGERKQCDLFVQLAEECADLSCEFVMAGYGEELFEIRKQNADKRLANFRFLGPVTFEESNRLISQAFVVVNCSKQGREGLPNVFIQSWLRGVPVLSLNTNPDGVLDGETYGICANGDFERMCSELRRLLNNPEKKNILGCNTYKYAKKIYSIENVVDKLIHLISEITMNTGKTGVKR